MYINAKGKLTLSFLWYSVLLFNSFFDKMGTEGVGQSFVILHSSSAATKHF